MYLFKKSLFSNTMRYPVSCQSCQTIRQRRFSKNFQSETLKMFKFGLFKI